jgi:large subunit ribosomal protein LP2
MRHLAAYLLLVVGGNSAPTADDVKTLLAAAGIEVDQERLTTLVSELEGKSLAELIAEGTPKLLIGTGGGGGGGGGGPAESGAAGGAADAAPKEEKPKEEEVDPLSGGMDMFGGGGGGGGGDY